MKRCGKRTDQNIEKEFGKMNKAEVFGCIPAPYGIQDVLVDCSIRNGFPGFDITGLPGTTIKESKERVRSALRS